MAEAEDKREALMCRQSRVETVVPNDELPLLMVVVV
jgi:hypothetical protein